MAAGFVSLRRAEWHDGPTAGDPAGGTDVERSQARRRWLQIGFKYVSFNWANSDSVAAVRFLFAISQLEYRIHEQWKV